jgi:predicted nucleic acid-binding protein
VAAFIEDVREHALVVAPTDELHVVSRDPDDNRVVEAAVAGEADYIVSGDEDLLDLGGYEGISIVSPARFAAILAAGADHDEAEADD